MSDEIEPIIQREIAKFARAYSFDLESMAQVARVEAWKAQERFDASKGSLHHFLTIRIRGAMLDEMTRQDPYTAWYHDRVKAGLMEYPSMIQLDAPNEEGGTLAEVIADERETVTPELHEMIEVAVASLDVLSEREQYVMREHFLNGRKMQDVGTSIGRTESRVSQIADGACRKLRFELKRRGF